MRVRIPFTKRAVELNLRSTLANPTEWLMRLLGGGKSSSGMDVNSKTALQISVVFACVKIISETIAMLKCNLYESLERGKRKATNLPLYAILHYLPNPETTSFDFWVMYIVNLLLTGDAFAYIKRDGNGKVLEIWNIPSKNVTIFRNKGSNELFYKVTDGEGKESIYYPENIMHTRGMRFDDADKSINPIITARNTLGLAMAQEEYASKYFANGAQVGGIVKYPTELDDEAYARFKEDFRQKYESVVNSNKILFLEDGADFIKISNNPEESQALEARQFQVVETCRIFNMPPHKIFDLSRSTNNNIEQQSIEFVQYCLGPYCVRLELTIYKDLLNMTQRQKFFAKFNTNALLRGDMNARKEFYQTMIQNGVYSPNDVLELEDENTYEGGDIHMVNGNMIPINRLDEVYKQKIMNGGDGSVKK